MRLALFVVALSFVASERVFAGVSYRINGGPIVGLLEPDAIQVNTVASGTLLEIFDDSGVSSPAA